MSHIVLYCNNACKVLKHCCGAKAGITFFITLTQMTVNIYYQVYFYMFPVSLLLLITPANGPGVGISALVAIMALLYGFICVQTGDICALIESFPWGRRNGDFSWH